jgi:hypothetical protein
MNNRKKTKNNNKKSYHIGGSSFEQKGVAAQIRPSLPSNSDLRKKLNEIVHSGDFYESKERNSFLNLDNDFDPEAQIKNKKDLSTKIIKRVLQGIAPVDASTTTATGYHKTSTKRMRTRTPTKNNTVTSTMTKSMNLNRSRSRRRRRTVRKSKI